MKLELKDLLHTPGGSLPFAFDLDLTQEGHNGGRPVTEPVSVCGQVRNTAGALVLSASLSSTLSLICDRCLKPFRREKRVEYEALLAAQLENGESDDIIQLEPDGSLELDELMRDVFLLALDTKNLCSEDCKGLCERCGANLNEEPCRCAKEVDPRLAVLAQLLEQD